MGWWSEDVWAAMVAGVDCPMCETGHLPTNEHGELLAELPGSFARLSYNQTQTGYAVLIAKRHAPEIYDLTDEELRLFWVDVAAVARTVASLFDPVKVDYLVMGHLCPHVHCHVYPQYQDDDPHGRLDPSSGDVRLPADEWQQRVVLVRETLGRSYPALQSKREGRSRRDQ